MTANNYEFQGPTLNLQKGRAFGFCIYPYFKPFYPILLDFFDDGVYNIK